MSAQQRADLCYWIGALGDDYPELTELLEQLLEAWT